jgi:hypothetical protein
MKGTAFSAALIAGLTAGATVFMPASAQAFTYTFGSSSTSSNSTATGASAFVDFEFSDVDTNVIQLDLTIKNTTGENLFGAEATTSKLTGFGFDLLEGLSVVDNSFSNTGYLDTFLTDAKFNPFPSLDIAFADNNNFLGGKANGALAQGQTTTASIRLSLTDSSSAQQIEDAFFTALSSGNLNIGARFQQVNAGSGSDKLSGGSVSGGSVGSSNTEDDSVKVPEPGTLLGMGLVAGVFASIRRRIA